MESGSNTVERVCIHLGGDGSDLSFGGGVGYFDLLLCLGIDDADCGAGDRVEHALLALTVGKQDDGTALSLGDELLGHGLSHNVVHEEVLELDASDGDTESEAVVLEVLHELEVDVVARAKRVIKRQFGHDVAQRGLSEQLELMR